MRIEQNSNKAFEQLYSAYFLKLTRFAEALTGSRQEAENIVQNVFLDILERQHKIVISETINVYLFRSVKSRCINFLISQARKGYKEYPLADGGTNEMIRKTAVSESFDELDTPEREIEKMIATALDSLPKKTREVFSMSRIEKMDHSQIAERLGISRSTVNNQIQRAMRKIREKFSLPK